ncbi:hypothetical protein LX86_009012 [Lentzea aerocolonigenes]|nr:hypothetical protein [Lentzea aerocolonigenes]
MFEGVPFNAATLSVAALGVLVALAGAFFAWRALFPPRRRLTVTEQSVVSMLSNASHEMTGVEVTRGGQKLVDPHIVSVTVNNAGRHAVTSDHFDQGRPVVIDLGVPVIEVIKSCYGGKSGFVDVRCSVNGTAVALGPDLLPRKSELVVQVLTSGRPKLTSVDHRLVDTAVQVVDRGREVFVTPRVALGAAVVGMVVSTLAGAWAIKDIKFPPIVQIAPITSSGVVEEGSSAVVLGVGFAADERVRYAITDRQGQVLRPGAEMRADSEGVLRIPFIAPVFDDVGRAASAAPARTLVFEMVREDGAKVAEPFVLVGV